MLHWRDEEIAGPGRGAPEAVPRVSHDRGEEPRHDRGTLPDAVRRRRDVALAGHRGDTDTPRAALTDPHPEVRAAALGALARCDDLPAAVLARAAADPSPLVRRRVAVLVAAAGTTAAEDQALPLVDLLDDDDDAVVETAAFAAGEWLAAWEEVGRPPSVAAPRCLDRLVSLAVDHADALVRESAVAALGAAGDPAGLPAILTATTDKPAVRRRAVLALAPFDGPEVTAALERARTDRDWQTRQAADDLLSEPEPTG